ncbi:dipeptide ABC transporter ATP-binding protein [Pseudonocardia sp. GCM10023141]|uniref:dipeptide ABC transporter ATP-binding protein n=1 Tax=Pseudonocardia sp. GCM10023141 TaxID=3252653 RepID=UPI00361C2327
MTDTSRQRRGHLRFDDFHAHFDTPTGPVHAVRGVSFDVRPGERFGIVGESGSGKSVTAHAVLRLMPAARLSGRIALDDVDLLGLREKDLRTVRGRRVAMVFQDPMTALNPLRTIGSQVVEAARHRGLPPAAARAEAVDRLTELGIPRAESRFDDYPHQFSGGMRQRVVIAAALMGEPDVLIADEPTTALDVRLQARLLDLLGRLSEERGMSILLISHDLGLVADFAQRVAVMYAGALRETASAQQFLRAPAHPYTRGLLGSIPHIRATGGPRLQSIPGSPPSLRAAIPGCAFEPRCASRSDVCGATAPVLVAVGGTEHAVACHHPHTTGPGNKGGGREPGRRDPRPGVSGTKAPPDLLVVEDLVVEHLQRDGGVMRAVDRLSLRIPRGSCFGLVGESGSGKTTAARAMLGLVPPAAGRIFLDGQSITGRSRRELKTLRKRMQLVYQDPQSSLDGLMTCGDVVAEALVVHGMVPDRAARRNRVRELFGQVGLPDEALRARPGELSGGQMQRVAIARALALEPELLVCDEVVSALDVSVQATILNLLKDLQEQFALTMLFISHDLGVVSYLCDQVAVMYRGELVEHGPTSDVLVAPTNPYTKELLEASPRTESATDRGDPTVNPRPDQVVEPTWE